MPNPTEQKPAGYTLVAIEYDGFIDFDLKDAEGKRLCRIYECGYNAWKVGMEVFSCPRKAALHFIEEAALPQGELSVLRLHN